MSLFFSSLSRGFGCPLISRAIHHIDEAHPESVTGFAGNADQIQILQSVSSYMTPSLLKMLGRLLRVLGYRRIPSWSKRSLLLLLGLPRVTLWHVSVLVSCRPDLARDRVGSLPVLVRVETHFVQLMFRAGGRLLLRIP